MGSAGGVGGGNAPVVLDQGMIKFQGKVLDPRDAEDLTKVTSLISEAQLQTLEADLGAQGLVSHGDKFVSIQDYSSLTGGPVDAGEGDEVEEALREFVYEPNRWVYPHGNSTAAVAALVAEQQGFEDSVSLVKEYFENPTAENQAAFIKQFHQYTQRSINIHEILFLVFKESIKETNLDKKYFLEKLKDYNDMGEDLSSYLRELVEASAELSEYGEGKKYPEKERVFVDVKEFDLAGLNKDGHLSVTSNDSRSLDRNSLNDQIKMVESMQETVRNKRQMASTSFQNFDQKSQQLYNLISSVIKAMNEMRSGTVRNML